MNSSLQIRVSNENKVQKQSKVKSFVGVWNYDHETGKVYWSDSLFDFTARDKKKGPLNSIDDPEATLLYSKEEWETIVRNTEKMFKTGIAWKGHFKIKTLKTKTVKYHRATFYPDFDKSGNVLYFNGEVFECSEKEYLKHNGNNSLTEYSLNPDIQQVDFSCFDQISNEGLLGDSMNNFQKEIIELFEKKYDTNEPWWQLLNEGEKQNAIKDFNDFVKSQDNILHYQYRSSNLSIVLSVTYIHQSGNLNALLRFRGFSNILMEDYRFLSDNMLNEIPASICILDLKHRYQLINKGAVKVPDIRTWLPGKTDFEYCQEYKKDLSIAIRRRHHFNQTLITEKSSFFEEYFPDNNGGIYHLRTYSLIKDNNGLPLFVLGYGIEITELKKHEETLTKLNLAIEAAMDGISLLNEKGEFYYMNDAHAQIFKGKSPSQFIGKKLNAIYNKHELERIENKILPLVKENGFWSGETIGVTQDNQSINLEISLTALSDGGLICICRDNTERKLQEMEMRKLAVVAEETHSSIMIADSAGNIEWVNHAFETLTGYSKTELNSKDALFFVGKDTNKDVVNSMRKALDSGQIYNGEVLCYRKNKKKIWTHLNITPVFDSSGKLDKFIAVLNDISLLKEAELNINKAMMKEKELSDLKTKFVSLASHEFRTPLAGIQSSVDLASLFLSKDRPDSIEKVRHYLSRIQSQIDRLTFILNDVLQLGKINMGKVSFSPTLGDLDEFIQDQLERLDKENLLSGRTLKYQYFGEKKNVKYDGVLLAHILQNLISNAIKYSEKRPDPEVQLHYMEDKVQIHVIDYGIGIHKKEIKQLFDSFFRGANTENIQGTGLGLVIVKQFIDAHKGEITVKSELNKGSNFVLSLPYK
jgi:PAS domain S-box-containing protein